ncbi:MAG: hypothetical protein IJ614_01910 [Prevotella sp.]|nr:hypothetical protein [Prevotella sp.]
MATNRRTPPLGDIPTFMLRLHAMRAATVVERFFPPKNADEAYAILAALNLLNAIVKQPEGTTIVSYGYIKGMAACMFMRLADQPMEAIKVYWDGSEDVAYFRVAHADFNGLNIQFGFHHVPILSGQTARFKQLQPQAWDGIELQPHSIQLFQQACQILPPFTGTALKGLTEKMLHFRAKQARQRLKPLMELRKPVPVTHRKKAKRLHIYQDPAKILSKGCIYKGRKKKMEALSLALHFNIWATPQCSLYRRGDGSCINFIRYDGSNYYEVKNVVVRDVNAMRIRAEYTLEPGRLYFCNRRVWLWSVLAPANHSLAIAHYNYLKVGNGFRNLCLTYGIARYLACRFPELRFVNVLNYTRMVCHRHQYNYRQLTQVPLGSKSRSLKVWMLIDEKGLLGNFKISELPKALIKDYLATPDYYQYFTVIRKKNGCGLYAYSRFHLLPCIYKNITLKGHFAQVLNDDNKIALYSLMQECFISDFIYDSIWYDRASYQMVARCNGQRVVIHDFAPWLRTPAPASAEVSW